MKITFYGGTKSVTGANYLLDDGTTKILVDCGLFQGSRYSEELNHTPFGYDASEIDYVLVTHSHVDHMGRLPKLYRDGFRGRVIATEPTRGVIEVALPDTLEKMTEEAKNMGHEPLYDLDDYEGIMDLFEGVPYKKTITLSDSITATFHDASHILGSAIIEIMYGPAGQQKRILFSGDLGNPPTHILQPIDYVEEADYLVIESAYGNRIHEDRDMRQNILERTIEDTVSRGGVLMIPSFAVERTQELLLEMDELFRNKRIPQIPVFVDSPLAINITKVYEQFSHYFNADAVKVLKPHGGLFQFPWLTFTPTVQESKHINDTPAPKIIIAGSGMSMGGRILHHERRYLPDSKSTILFVGYQVAGSLGRRIFDGEPQVRLFGEMVSVHCHVHAIGAYSAHADQNGLMALVKSASQGDRLKKVFVVQGEEDSASALAKRIKADLSIEAIAPDTGYTVDIS